MKYLFIVTLLLSSLYANSFQETLSKAKQGDINAQNKVGEMYYMGNDVEQDFEKAAKWFKKASNVGHAKAQINLGLMFYKGEGVKKDKSQAYKLWLESANNGNTLAKKYVDGLCKQNPSICK